MTRMNCVLPEQQGLDAPASCCAILIVPFLHRDTITVVMIEGT